MQDQTNTAAKPLSPDDLKVLDAFLDAWCNENGSNRADAAALTIASSLIDWYQKDEKFRARARRDETGQLALSPHIERLLRQLT